MQLVKQSHYVEDWGADTEPLVASYVLGKIERAGRTCYKSSEGSWEDTKAFVAKIIRSGHHSVLEHHNITVRFITNRGILAELTRHRLASYSVESTRYCNYGSDHVKFIIPPWCEHVYPGIWTAELGFGPEWEFKPEVKYDYFNKGGYTDMEIEWMWAMVQSEERYKSLIKAGLSPQFARGVLPIDLKTEIVMTANLREWRHVFSLRCSNKAHPQIRALMLPLLAECQEVIPVVFDDLQFKEE